MSKKNSNDTIGNRTRDLPGDSAVPQTTALPRAYNTGPKFCFTNIVCGMLGRWATVNEVTGSDKRRILVRYIKKLIRYSKDTS
jgi:hypothetical protein